MNYEYTDLQQNRRRTLVEAPETIEEETDGDSITDRLDYINSVFNFNVIPINRTCQCKVIRTKNGSRLIYTMFLEQPDNSRIFLLSARKKRTIQSYDIYKSIGQEKQNKIATIGSNILGTCFSGSKIKVFYKVNVFGLSGPRKVSLEIPGIDPETKQTKQTKQRNQNVFLHNKQPVWSEDTEAFVLNFNGRVSLASIKNFQIISDQDPDYIVFQFGKVAENIFSLDFKYPLTATQAFQIALTSFGRKLACE